MNHWKFSIGTSHTDPQLNELAYQFPCSFVTCDLKIFPTTHCFGDIGKVIAIAAGSVDWSVDQGMCRLLL